VRNEGVFKLRPALRILPVLRVSQLTFALWGAVAFAGIAAAQETQGGKLNARELFYAAAQAPSAAPQAGSPAKATPKTAAKKAQPSATETARTSTPQAPVAQPSAPAPPPSQPATASVSTDVAKVIRASVQSAPAGPPLGLKYTILKLAGGNMMETAPDSVFHAGDRIQINVETNWPGYLYIVTQGSSGTWKPMFPSPEVADGNNRVEGWRTSVLPSPKTRILFDEQKGIEKLFVVFSREPEPDLEKMIYSLQGDKTTPTADPAPQPAQPQKLLMASAAAIDDGTVGRLRNTYARDLVIEKVDENTPGNSPSDKKETAVYVVNPSGSPDSRVVADIQLVHQ